MRLQPVDQRADAVAQAWRIVVEIDPGAADRGLDPAGNQVDVVRLKLAFGEQVLAVDKRVLAIHVEAPAVERADEAGSLAIAVIVALAAGEGNAAVAAGVEVGFHPALRVDDDHRLADGLVFHPVAHFGNPFQPGRHLPGMRPDMLELELVEFLVVIARRRDALGIVDGKRHGAQAAIG